MSTPQRGTVQRGFDSRGQTKRRKPKPKLTAAQRRARVNDRNPLYNPGEQLSGNALRRAAEQLVDLQFQPQQRAIQRLSANAERQGGQLASNASDYYLRLAQHEQGAVTRQQAIGSELQARLGTITDQTQVRLDALADQAQQGQQEATNVTGIGGVQSQAGVEALAAQRRQASDAQAIQSAGAAQAANYAGLQQIGQQANMMRGGEVQERLAMQLANQLAEYRGQGQQLAEQRGNAVGQAVGTLRQQGFENLMTQGALELDAGKLQASVQEDIRANRTARARIKSAERTNRQRLRVSEANNRRTVGATIRGQDDTADQRARDRSSREQIAAMNVQARERIAAAGRKNAAGKTEPADARKVKSGISNAVSLISNGPGFQKRGNDNPQGWAKRLRSMGAPEIVVRAATERATGGLSPQTAAELRTLGVQVPRDWLRPRRGSNRGRNTGAARTGGN
jgi:hypothetical protein